MAPKAASAKQMKFVKELVGDLEQLMYAGKPEAVEADFCAWFGGVVNKHSPAPEKVFFTKREHVDEWVAELSSYQAWKLIPALSNMRDRMDAKVPRENIKTPENLRIAIWKAASDYGYDAEFVADAVFGATDGETASTKQMRRKEALSVLKKLGGRVVVYEMTPPKREGGKPGTRKTERTQV